jgi:hypothetical protein
MTDIAATVAAFILGVVLGQFVQFRRVEKNGRTMLKPELDTRPFRSRVLNMALVAMFLVSTCAVVLFTYTQRECNHTFQQSLKNNSAIGAQDRALEVRDDALRERRDDAMDVLVEELLVPSTSTERVHDVLEVYRDTVRDNAIERDKLNAERLDLESQRTKNPYPDPRC